MLYLDNAATSRFKPRAVLRTLKRCAKSSANAGRSAHADATSAAALIERSRNFISELNNNKNIIFTKNCTEALNLALFGLNLSGDVLVSPMAHNSMLRPLKQLELDGKISLRFLPPSYPAARDYTTCLSGGVTMVALPHISNVSGISEKLDRLARETKKRGILLLVDAAQSAGYLDQSLADVDLVAVSGHKGLHSPQGSGYLAMRPDLKLKPLLYGGTGLTTMSLVQGLLIPEDLEAGTQNLAAQAALFDGVAWSVKNMHKNTAKLEDFTSYATAQLSALEYVKVYSGRNPVGIVTFNVAGLKSTETAALLGDKYGIAVRGGLHCAPLAHRAMGTEYQGAVRASFGCDNTLRDVEQLIRAVRHIADKRY